MQPGGQDYKLVPLDDEVPQNKSVWHQKDSDDKCSYCEISNVSVCKHHRSKSDLCPECGVTTRIWWHCNRCPVEDKGHCDHRCLQMYPQRCVKCAIAENMECQHHKSQSKLCVECMEEDNEWWYCDTCGYSQSGHCEHWCPCHSNHSKLCQICKMIGQELWVCERCQNLRCCGHCRHCCPGL